MYDFSDQNFKRIQGFSGYLIGDKGEVVSLDYAKSGEPRMLIGETNTRGYLHVSLYSNGEKTTKYIHRLTAKAFVPNPDGKPEINHIDGDKKNNCALNLEWVSSAENSRHAAQNGLLPRGADNGKAKMTEGEIRRIRQRYSRDGAVSQSRLAEEFGVSQNHISRIVNYEVWQHVE